MRVLVLLISCFFCCSQALECGILNLTKDQFKKVITECVSDKETLDKLWEMASLDASEEDGSIGSDEEVPVTRGTVNNKTTLEPRKRYNRARGSRFNNESPMSNVQRRYGSQATSATTEETTTLAENQTEENTSMNNIGETEEGCILQCVLEKLEMTDSNGVADHKKFADALLKSVSGKEMRDFIQESTDECFQQMTSEDANNPCQYSSKLITCLADQGKTNCEDWPVGNISGILH